MRNRWRRSDAERVVDGVHRLRVVVISDRQAIAREPFDSDYQLLLGYQHLGMGALDKARIPLKIAAGNPANYDAAGKLLELADKLEAETAKSK